MDTVYFGEQGLTSTSANYIASKAAQYIQAGLAHLEDVRFTSKAITVVGSDKTHTIYSSIDVNGLEDIKGILNIVTECYSLEAWLREAIKAKEALVTDIENLSLGSYLEQLGEEYMQMPCKESTISEKEIVDAWSVKDRARYYTLQTRVSVLGNNIFKGNIKAQRDNYYKRLNEPTVINGQGRDTLIEEYTCSIPKDDMEKFFMEMNEAHRKAQAELNGMLHTITVAIEKDQAEKQEKYQEELLKYQSWLATWTEKLKAYKLQRLASIRNLKIIIPDRLKEIYGIVNNAGK